MTAARLLSLLPLGVFLLTPRTPVVGRPAGTFFLAPFLSERAVDFKLDTLQNSRLSGGRMARGVSTAARASSLTKELSWYGAIAKLEMEPGLDQRESIAGHSHNL